MRRCWRLGLKYLSKLCHPLRHGVGHYSPRVTSPILAEITQQFVAQKKFESRFFQRSAKNCELQCFGGLKLRYVYLKVVGHYLDQAALNNRHTERCIVNSIGWRLNGVKRLTLRPCLRSSFVCRIPQFQWFESLFLPLTKTFLGVYPIAVRSREQNSDLSRFSDDLYFPSPAPLAPNSLSIPNWFQFPMCFSALVHVFHAIPGYSVSIPNWWIT